MNNNETHGLLQYYVDVAKFKPLTREEETELGHKSVNNDQEAKDALVLSNLRLVTDAAFKYSNNYPDIRDIIQEGNYGLIYATKKYDPTRGVRFFSYAQYWVHAFIKRFLMANRCIVKLGQTRYTRDLYNGLLREKNLLEDDKNFDGDVIKELAEKFKCSEVKVSDMLALLASPDESLDCIGFDNDKNEFVEDKTEDKTVNIEDFILKQEEMSNFQEQIMKFKKTLDDRGIDIFTCLCLSDEETSLQEIGDKYGITRERVRQIRDVILSDFKHFVLTGKLKIRRKIKRGKT